MSQITAYGSGGGPSPAGGIETITGNNGGQIPGDGGTPNNINIIGAGIISTTGDPSTNTITITSTGAAAIFPTDNGSALPSILGDLSIKGGTNINTDALVANTVTVNLDDDVTLTGFLHAGAEVNAGTTITAAGDITSTAGDLSIHGNGTFGGGLLVTAISAFYDALTVGFVGGGGLFVDHGNIVLSAPGHLYLGGFTNGALVIDGSNQVTAATGVAGTVLTSNGAAAPTFQALPAPATLNFLGDTGGGTTSVANNITFNGAANQITVASPGSGAGHLTLAFTPSIVVANNITATTGNIVATAGNINATAGNLNALAGNVNTVSATFSGQPNGALVTNGAGAINALNGTIDQVLMAYPGHTPAFGSIVGAGGTNVNIGTQGTITISSAVVPAAVTVAGTANQISVAGGPAYTVSLPAAVITPGSLTTTGALASNTTLTTAGINTLNNLAVNGVVQTNAAHQLFASNAANGSVLIGTGVGAAPAWNTLTAGNGIAVTNTAGNITVATTNTAFSAALRTTTAAVTGDTTNYTITADYNVLNDGGYYNTGTGVYTVPTTGSYFFSITLGVAGISALNTLGQATIYVNGVYNKQMLSSNFYNASNGTAPATLTICGSTVVPLPAGAAITFVVNVNSNPTKNVSLIGVTTTISGWLMI